jgi:geranylgeranyl diphosphate synthase type II
MAKENDASELKNWLSTSDPTSAFSKINAVTSVYNRLGVKAICEDKMQFFYNKGIENLEKVSVSENKKQELRNLAEKLMLRQE